MPGGDALLSGNILIAFPLLVIFFLGGLFRQGWLVSGGIWVILGLWSTWFLSHPTLISNQRDQVFLNVVSYSPLTFTVLYISRQAFNGH